MRDIFAIARKEFLHIIRDPRSLTVAILMPVMMLLLYGYAIDMELKRLPVGVLDYSRSPESRALIREMTAGGFILNAATLASRDEIEPGFRRGRFRAAVVIPPDYASTLSREPLTPVQIIIDGADGTTAAVVSNYLQVAIARVNLAQLEALTGSRELPLEARTRVLFNPELRSANFIVPGLAALVMMMVCALLTSIALARERETGTLEQMLTTPVAATGVVAGKLLPYLGLGALDTALVFIVGRVVFDVPLHGSPWALAGYSLLYVTVALGFGLLISTIAKSQMTAMMAALMTTLLPTLLLSGFIFAIDSMPRVLQIISRAIPATYYLRVVRGILLRGVNWYPLEGGILLGMALLVVAVAVGRFRGRLE